VTVTLVRGWGGWNEWRAWILAAGTVVGAVGVVVSS